VVWKCVVTPNDGTVNGPTGEDQVTIGNSPPIGDDEEVTTNENMQYVFQISDFTFSDVDSGDTFQGIKVTILETVGALKLDNVDVIVDQAVSVADITSGKLTYNPASNGYGDDYDSYGFKVYDGTDYSTAAYTMTINVLREHQIILNDGWNIISVPYYDSVAKADIIVYYNSAPHTWSQAVTDGYVLDYLYNYDRVNQQYGFSNSLEPGYGYWVWANYDCTLLVYSNVDGNGHITDLKVGWDIMGLPYRTSIAKTTTHIDYSTVTYTWADAVTAHIILGFVYGWNSNSQVYELCDTFDPTRGYWMFSYQDCTLKE
jgi:hypothetical protein